VSFGRIPSARAWRGCDRAYETVSLSMCFGLPSARRGRLRMLTLPTQLPRGVRSPFGIVAETLPSEGDCASLPFIEQPFVCCRFGVLSVSPPSLLCSKTGRTKSELPEPAPFFVLS